MTEGFIPTGFRKLDDFAKDHGPEKVGALLAGGKLLAYRINPWGEMFPVEGDVWRTGRGRTIIEHGKFGDTYLGKPDPKRGDTVVVRVPKDPPTPSATVTRLRPVPAPVSPEVKKATGHPPVYDWEGALIIAARAIHLGEVTPGTRGAQAQLAEIMGSWFGKSGNVPGETALKAKAKRLLAGLDAPDT